VQLIIADTGPVNYPILIGHIDILPTLFERVILPSAVKDELADPNTPLAGATGCAIHPSGWKCATQVHYSAIPQWMNSARVRPQPSRWPSKSMPIYSSWMTGAA
jgi:hypothetical protein